MRARHANFEWQAPSPLLSSEPPPGGTSAAREWVADVFLTQLPRPPAREAGVSIGDLATPIKANRLTTNMLLVVSVQRSRLYAVVLPQRRTVRMVRWVRPLTAERTSLPGVEMVPPLPPIEVATTKLSPSSWVNVAALDYRMIEPSTFDLAEYRRLHPWTGLPIEYPSTSLPGNETRWRRDNIHYEPSVPGLGAGFVATYLRGKAGSDAGLTLHRIFYTISNDGEARRTVTVEHAEHAWQVATNNTEVEAHHSTVIEAEEGLTTMRLLAFQDEREYLQ